MGRNRTQGKLLLRSAGRKRLQRYVPTFLCLLITAIASSVRLNGQEGGSDTASASDLLAGETIDRTWHLDIDRNEIDLGSLDVALNARLGSTHQFRVDAGVALTAEQILLTLVSVQGDVHFRATLQPLLDVLNRHRIDLKRD